jgi:hypothetical protein
MSLLERQLHRIAGELAVVLAAFETKDRLGIEAVFARLVVERLDQIGHAPGSVGGGNLQERPVRRPAASR